MADQTLSECINDLLECPICLELMTDPRLFPCQQGHSFCDKCVHRLAISSISLTTAACPLCRQDVPITDSGLILTTRDVTRMKLLDSNKHCGGNQRFCSKHPKERVRRFCKQCRAYVCCDCLVEGLHTEHSRFVVGIVEAEEEMHALLSRVAAQAKEQMERLSGHRQDYINASEAEKQKLRSQVDKRFNELSDQLHAEKQRLYDKIDKYIPPDVDPLISQTYEQAKIIAEDVTGSLQLWASLEKQCTLYDKATTLLANISDVTPPPIHISDVVQFVEAESVFGVGDIFSHQTDALRSAARRRPPRPPPPEKSKVGASVNCSATALSLSSSDAVTKANFANALISDHDQEHTAASTATLSSGRLEQHSSPPTSERQPIGVKKSTDDLDSIAKRKSLQSAGSSSHGKQFNILRVRESNRLSAIFVSPEYDSTGRLCRYKSVGQLETRKSGCRLM